VKRTAKGTSKSGGSPVQDRPSDGAESAAQSRYLPIVRRLLLGAVAMLYVAAPLIAADGSGIGDVGLNLASGLGIALVMMWLVLLVAWAAWNLRRPRPTLRFGFADAALLLLLILHTISAIVMAPYGNARAGLNALWQWISFGVAFFLVRQLVGTRLQARALAVLMIAIAAGLSAYGMYQYAYELPAKRRDYQSASESKKREVLRNMGIGDSPGSPDRVSFESRLASVEPLGTFALTNSLAGLLAPWLLVSGAVCVFLPVGRDSRMRVVPVALFAGLLIAGCLLLTKSRSGYLAVLAGAVLLGGGVARQRGSAWYRQLKLRVPLLIVGAAVLVVAAMIAAAAAMGGLDVAVLTEAPKSVLYRLQYWQSSGAMIADHPWFGCGPGNFQDYYTAYKLPQASETVADPHNFLFEVWATAGTPAVLALVAAIGCVAWQVWRRSASGEIADIATASGFAPYGDDSTSAKKRSATSSRRERAGGRKRAARGGASRGRIEKKAASSDSQPSWWQTAWGDASLPMMFGALLGGLLAYPCWMLDGRDPVDSVVCLVLIVSVGVVVAWLLFPWVQHGRMPAWVPMVAAAVLLVHLSASGGIGFPGVAHSLWLLAALALCTAEAPSEPGDSGEPRGPTQQALAKPVAHAETAEPVAHTQAEGPMADAESLEPAGNANPIEPNPTRAPNDRLVIRPAIALALSIGAALLVGACYITAYAPIYHGMAALSEGARWQQERKYDRADEEIHRAARWDPYSAEPWRYRASLALGRWMRALTNDPVGREWFDQFERYAQEALARSPHSSARHREVGEWYLAAYVASGDRSLLRKAASTTRRAAELYPNSNTLHAQLAWLHHLVGDSREAEAEAEEALRLDALNPHEEQKLARQKVFHPPKIEGVPYHQEPAPDMNAEQLMERLRTIEGRGDNP